MYELLWPDGIIPYDDSELDPENKLLIGRAMDIWENVTCLRFVPCNVDCGWHFFYKNVSGLTRYSSSMTARLLT